MKPALHFACPLLLGFVFVSFVQRYHASLAQTAPANGNTIKLLALNQPPCSVPSPESMITARLAYHITEQEQSEHGFSVSIKFQGTDPRMTFSMGLAGQKAGETLVTSRNDTLTLRYPMAAIWGNPRLKRPITCYFYLHRYTAPGRSTVIAKTPPVVFAECQ
ncbi:hypothetical protein [Hymenobacter sp. GOD-10R]|uniref:hypothetical protein n=1 Tax=Hymenobacter sp. GOD-10R TaxID=3093922 RepID=UPI002D787473|nr:hypothetical protein [Hymenobacter sp. GOD-10R]WRQ30049.1 hypothetical protein SD425_07220 [Hymenobacter sp. GOD-10R]